LNGLFSDFFPPSLCFLGSIWRQPVEPTFPPPLRPPSTSTRFQHSPTYCLSPPQNDGFTFFLSTTVCLFSSKRGLLSAKKKTRYAEASPHSPATTRDPFLSYLKERNFAPGFLPSIGLQFLRGLPIKYAHLWRLRWFPPCNPRETFC